MTLIREPEPLMEGKYVCVCMCLRGDRRRSQRGKRDVASFVVGVFGLSFSFFFPFFIIFFF